MCDKPLVNEPTSKTSPQQPLSAGGERSPSRASLPSISKVEAGSERPMRVQMTVALVLGLALVAVPLYLWRRPRTDGPVAESTVTTPGVPVTLSSATLPAGATPGAPGTIVAISPAEPAKAAVQVTDVRVVACHDLGPRKISAADCGHVDAVEKAFAAAVRETGTCLAEPSPGATVGYSLDVNFAKHTKHVVSPKDARSIRSAKVVAPCLKLVKEKVDAMAIDQVPHDHARYRFMVSATYPTK